VSVDLELALGEAGEPQSRGCILREISSIGLGRRSGDNAMSRIGLLETVWQDVKYSLRMMSRNPAFSVAIILTVAVGIGANAAMFSVIRSLAKTARV
jgi:hypothetical protein